MDQANLIVLDLGADTENAYEQANQEIVRQAAIVSAPVAALAIAVWEGRARTHADFTATFLRLAVAAGMKKIVVKTC